MSNPSTKRLLLISRCPPYPLYLGDRLILWHLVRYLKQRGWVVDLLAFANYDTDWNGTGAYAGWFNQVQLFDEPPRGLLAYLRRMLFSGQRFPETAGAAWSPDMWRAIESAVSQTDYDAIQLFGGIHVYEFYHALGGRPALITPYESYSLYLKRLIEQTGALPVRLQQFVARQYESWMFSPYDRVSVIAEPDREELLQINPALTIDVIPNGIDLDLFKPAQAEREPATLLFVGNYEYEPNQDAARLLATEILPHVREQIPKASLLLVGHHPPPDVLALANDYVTVTGSVPDVQPYLARATVFVCPLRFGAGLKNKVLEALAVGIPVVASPVSVDGIHVVDGESALVADVDDMAGAVVRLLRDRALQEQLSVKGRQLVELQYSWSHTVDLYEDVYNQLTGKGTVAV